jgi:hypothetical protein
MSSSAMMVLKQRTGMQQSLSTQIDFKSKKNKNVNLLLHFHQSKDWQLSDPDGLYYFGASSSFPQKHQLLL